jgi:hypothetical protein
MLIDFSIRHGMQIEKFSNAWVDAAQTRAGRHFAVPSLE